MSAAAFEISSVLRNGFWYSTDRPGQPQVCRPGCFLDFVAVLLLCCAVVVPRLSCGCAVVVVVWCDVRGQSVLKLFGFI